MRKPEDIKKEIKENKTLLKAKTLLKDERDFLEGEIKDLEKELEKALAAADKKSTSKKAPTKKAPAKKKASPKKTPAKKAPAKKKASPKKTTPKSKRYVIYKEEKVYEDDPKWCDALAGLWHERKAKMKKRGGKRKTRSVMERIASDVSSSVMKGVKNYKDDDIKKNPKAVIKKMERMERAGKEFLDSIEDIIGDKLSKKEIEKEFGGIDKVIEGIKIKYIGGK